MFRQRIPGRCYAIDKIRFKNKFFTTRNKYNLYLCHLVLVLLAKCNACESVEEAMLRVNLNINIKSARKRLNSRCFEPRKVSILL